MKAHLHLYATKNNSLLCLTDVSGTYTFFRISAGQISKTDRNKTSIYTSISLISELLQVIKKKKISSLSVFIKGKGSGYRENRIEPQVSIMLKTLKKEIQVSQILNVTPIAHDGVRLKGGRRGRRV